MLFVSQWWAGARDPLRGCLARLSHPTSLAGAPSRKPRERRGAYVRIDLRRYKALVPKQLLHAADIGPAVQ